MPNGITVLIIPVSEVYYVKRAEGQYTVVHVPSGAGTPESVDGWELFHGTHKDLQALEYDYVKTKVTLEMDS